MLGPRKQIGLVAHDHRKADLIEWARFNSRLLAQHDLVATGTTGTLLEEEMGVESSSSRAARSVVISSWAR